MTPVHIRTMTPDDLDFATSCTRVVGWFAQRSEFEGFYAHDPQGCLVAEAKPTACGGLAITFDLCREPPVLSFDESLNQRVRNLQQHWLRRRLRR